MATELPRPGVEVIQQFRTTSPTVTTPTLVPCVVGVAKQVVEVLTESDSGSSLLNVDALITLHAFFIAKSAVGNPPLYAGLHGLNLVTILNNGLPVTFTFADPVGSGLPPASVVAQVTDQLLAQNISGMVAETVGTTQWRLRSVGTGQFQTLQIATGTSPAVLTAFGLGINHVYAGLEAYNEYELTIPPAAFPDPRKNLEELSIQNETLRLFLATEGNGVGLAEPLRTESFLRNGAVNDAATLTGSVNLTTLTYPGGVQGKTMTLNVNGLVQSYTIATSPASAAALRTELAANFTGVTFTIVANNMVLTSTVQGQSSSLITVTGTLLTDLGFTNGQTDSGVSIAAVDDGNGDVLTPILEFDNQNFTLAPTAAVLTGSQATTTPAAGSTLILTDGQQPQTVVFDGTETTVALIFAKINAQMSPAAGGRITASASGSALRLTHDDLGDESYIGILGGTALSALDGGGSPVLVAGASMRGVPFKPLPGDALYIDGALYGTILQVAPGGNVERLKIDRQVAISTNVGARFYIQAKNLVAGGSSTRPYPDLTVDLAGNVVVKHSFLRDPYGVPVLVSTPMYMMYTAIRQDVTSAAATPGLLSFDNTNALDSALAPVNVTNPLALGLYFALINAPGAQVTGLGVDEISADQPFGTVDAYARAAEYLEGVEVYAIAPMTHDETVSQVFDAHVRFMSEPGSKGERIVILNPTVPTRRLDTLAASGANGDAISTVVFDTKIAALAALVQAAGVSPVGTLPVSAGVFLDIEGDANSYSVQSITGSQVTLRTAFAGGQNDDGFYSTSQLVLPIIATSFAIRVRGTALVTVDGLQDKQAVAETMQALGQSYKNRRTWITFPDKAAATIDGVEQIIDGFYMSAAIAGMVGQQPPQQGFTNFPMVGFTRVLGSSNVFSDRQLNIIAGGGVYIIVQDALGLPLISRHSVTSDLSSVETREVSITKTLDFVAKFLRKAVRTFIGRFNITQAFLDSLGTVLQGLATFLVDAGIVIDLKILDIIQDEDEPDAILIDCAVDVAYPCNRIRITLAV